MEDVGLKVRYFRFNAPPEVSPASVVHTPLLGEIVPGCIYAVTNASTAVQLVTHPHYEEVGLREYQAQQFAYNDSSVEINAESESTQEPEVKDETEQVDPEPRGPQTTRRLRTQGEANDKE